MQNLKVGNAAKNNRKTKEETKQDLEDSIVQGDKHENEELEEKSGKVEKSYVLEKFILTVEPFAKALRIFEMCVLVNKNLCKKLDSSLKLPTIFDKSFKVTSVPFFLDFNLLSRKLENFLFKGLYWVIFYYIKGK